jgi:endonuclease/exonuclease/phosphatase family metal-dependent hydrolase
VRLPPGNFVAADVETSLGTVRVIGIVIRYNQNREYITELPRALERTVTARTVLAGDFNLRIPGGRLSDQLVGVLAGFGLSAQTTGDHLSLAAERPLIDHIAISADLTSEGLDVWSRRDPRFRHGTTEVTDHAGAALDLYPADR